MRPQSGSISIDGLDVTNLAINLRTRKFGVGYCPQYSGYFHDLTVEENLFAVGEILIKDKKDRKSKIDESIGYFELESVLKLKASNLSGGLKKRLAIAEVFACFPFPKVQDLTRSGPRPGKYYITKHRTYHILLYI